MPTNEHGTPVEAQDNANTVDAVVVEEVRPTRIRPTRFVDCWSQDGVDWHIGRQKSSTMQQAIALIAKTPTLCHDIIRIPGTRETAYLKERAELLGELHSHAITVTSMASSVVDWPRFHGITKLRVQKIRDLDAAHEKGGNDEAQTS